MRPSCKIFRAIQGVLYPASIARASASGKRLQTESYTASQATLSWMFPGVTSTASTKPCRSRQYAPRSKLPLVLAFYKHPAVRVCGRHRFLAFGRFVVVLVLNFFLAELCTLLVYFFAAGLHRRLSRLVDLLLLEFLLVCTCLNVCAIDKDYTGVYHTVV